MSKFLKFLKLSVIVLVVATTLSGLPTSSAKHLYQQQATENELADGYSLVKYVVSIRRRRNSTFFGDNHYCAGTIIAPKTIVTAAHCLMDFKGNVVKPYSINVVAGTPNRLTITPFTKIMDVKRVIKHPKYNYNNGNYSYDVGLLVLEDELYIDNKTIAVLPLVNVPLPAGTVCYAVGWGRLYSYGPMSDEALYINISLWSFPKCKARFPFISDGMLCANDATDVEKDACRGDSGGPLICDGMLTGVVSFGMACGLFDFPGVYTNIWAYRTWILSNCAFKPNINLVAVLVLPAMLLQLFVRPRLWALV